MCIFLVQSFTVKVINILNEKLRGKNHHPRKYPKWCNNNNSNMSSTNSKIYSNFQTHGLFAVIFCHENYFNIIFFLFVYFLLSLTLSSQLIKVQPIVHNRNIFPLFVPSIFQIVCISAKSKFACVCVYSIPTRF